MLGCEYETTCAGSLAVLHPEPASSRAHRGVSGRLLSYLLRQQGVAPPDIANEYSLLVLPCSLHGHFLDYFRSG